MNWSFHQIPTLHQMVQGFCICYDFIVVKVIQGEEKNLYQCGESGLMKKYLTVFIILAISALVYWLLVREVKEVDLSSTPSAFRVGGVFYLWQTKAPMPTPRTEATAAVVAGEVYVIGGLGSLGRTLATVEIYNPREDRWRLGPPLPAPRHHAAAVALENKLYVLGGFEGIINFRPKDEVFVLEPGRSSVWQKVASLPEPRGALGAAVIDGQIYIVGGINRTGPTSSLYVYDPKNNVWQEKKSAGEARDHLAVAAIEKKLYVAGGRRGTLTSNLATLEIYDPVSDEWHRGPDMPTARGGVAGAVLDDLFVVFGGESPGKTFSQVEAYRPATGEWQTLPPLPTARHGLAAAPLGGTVGIVFVAGGGRRPGLSVSSTNEALIRPVF